MKIRITFTEPLLGTLPGNPEIAKEFILSRNNKPKIEDDEVDALPADEAIQNSSTVFPRDPETKQPFLWDYQIKGFLKDACSMLKRVKTTKSSKVTAYKKVIDGLIFPTPRKIYINVVGEITWCQRPLRGQTAQGERISLANSESIPAGSFIETDIVCLDEALEKLVIEWLNYGAVRGIGQWRNSGMGRFSWLTIE